MIPDTRTKQQIWDDYHMAQAHHAATLSKDESTKLGCVIIGPDRDLRSSGYNSFPRGINDNVRARQERPKKYFYFEHAERNAIYNIVRSGGASLKGCTLYCAWLPCADCARAIIQAGIIEVVIEEETPLDRWSDSMEAAKEMLGEAGVIFRKMGATEHLSGCHCPECAEMFRDMQVSYAVGDQP